MSTLKRVLPVLVVLFLGYLGFSLVLPLFPPMFLNPDHPFLPYEMGTDTRRILLGILFAMYPLGQFVGAPLLGKLSDRFGRKSILLISLTVVIPAYLGSAFSVAYALPVLLYVSRFLSGLLEGNVVIAQAAIADISEDPKSKTQNFGWLVSLSSTAFFFGPLIGGKLADKSLSKWFDYDTPFWGAAILTGIGILIVWKMFQETHAPDPDVEVSVKSLTRTFTDGFKLKKLRTIYAANFTLFSGMFFFLNFFSAFLVNKYGFGTSLLGEVNAYLAIPITFSPLCFGLFAKWWTSRQSMRFGALMLCISLLIFVMLPSPWALLATLLPVGFFLSMGFAFPAIMVSDTADKRSQGAALGTNQSLQVLGEALTALIGGFLMVYSNNIPVYAGAFCAVVAASILFLKPPKPKVL